MSPDEREAILDAHPENAHAKRARGSDLYLEKPVVIVDGRTPGGLFEREPIRLSDYYVAAGNERPQYYLRDEIASEWNVRAGGSNMMFKPAYRCAPRGRRFGRWWGFREHERSITPIASKGDRRALSLSTDRASAEFHSHSPPSRSVENRDEVVEVFPALPPPGTAVLDDIVCVQT